MIDGDLVWHSTQPRLWSTTLPQLATCRAPSPVAVLLSVCHSQSRLPDESLDRKLSSNSLVFYTVRTEQPRQYCCSRMHGSLSSAYRHSDQYSIYSLYRPFHLPRSM